eukprot:6177895-Pleurochrysis_carterae.AAC.3
MRSLRSNMSSIKNNVRSGTGLTPTAMSSALAFPSLVDPGVLAVVPQVTPKIKADDPPFAALVCVLH